MGMAMVLIAEDIVSLGKSSQMLRSQIVEGVQRLNCRPQAGIEGRTRDVGALGVNHEDVDRDNILGGVVGSPVTLS